MPKCPNHVMRHKGDEERIIRVQVYRCDECAEEKLEEVNGSEEVLNEAGDAAADDTEAKRVVQSKPKRSPAKAKAGNPVPKGQVDAKKRSTRPRR